MNVVSLTLSVISIGSRGFAIAFRSYHSNLTVVRVARLIMILVKAIKAIRVIKVIRVNKVMRDISGLGLLQTSASSSNLSCIPP